MDPAQLIDLCILVTAIEEAHLSHLYEIDKLSCQSWMTYSGNHDATRGRVQVY